MDLYIHTERRLRFFEPKFIVPKSEIDHETKALIDHAFENLPSVLPSGAMDRPTFESRVIVNLLHMSKYLSGEMNTFI